MQGDHCLVTVARALGDVLRRATDVFARYGGEEFAAIVADDAAGAAALAETMRLRVESLGLKYEGSPFGVVTISLGVATCLPDPNSSPEALTKQADKALYLSKSNGRNQVSVDPDQTMKER